jgi:hypothetical protein
VRHQEPGELHEGAPGDPYCRGAFVLRCRGPDADTKAAWEQAQANAQRPPGRRSRGRPRLRPASWLERLLKRGDRSGDVVLHKVSDLLRIVRTTAKADLSNKRSFLTYWRWK